MAPGRAAGLSVLPCMSSLEQLPVHLCLCQQNLTGWSCRQASQQSSAGCLRGRAAFQERRLSGNPRRVPRAKACFKQTCVIRWCHPAQDGWASRGLGFLAKRGSNGRGINVKKAKAGNSAISPCFYFDVCKLHVFAEQIQMLNSCLSQKRSELLRHTCPGTNIVGLVRPLSTPCCLASMFQDDQAGCGLALADWRMLCRF